MTYLDKLIPGQSARVVGYKSDGPISRRLAELGLTPGRQIVYLRNAPLKDPLQLQLGSGSLSLRHAQAALIAVEIED
ncbi:MAG: FeoA domain-containing protein [candidate division Zixibacteria bacterium]|nr:FeoA domain-containing protein [candidate division Zixibacteria bacterium]